MSTEFKAVTNFLRSISTAAKIMADALEQAEKDLGVSTAVVKGTPLIENTNAKTGRCPPAEWITKNSHLDLSYADLVAVYNKETDTTELDAAEQNDLAKDAAEAGSEKKLLDGINIAEVLVQHGCVPQFAGILPVMYNKEIEVRNLEKMVGGSEH